MRILRRGRHRSALALGRTLSHHWQVRHGAAWTEWEPITTELIMIMDNLLSGDGVRSSLDVVSRLPDFTADLSLCSMVEQTSSKVGPMHEWSNWFVTDPVATKRHLFNSNHAKVQVHQQCKNEYWYFKQFYPLPSFTHLVIDQTWTITRWCV